MQPVKLAPDFQIIAISRAVYCDSRGFYHFGVRFVNAGKTRFGYLENGDIHYTTNRDSRAWYLDLTDAARAALYSSIEKQFDQFTVYEIDRDGHTRYENLRYHDPERFRSMWGPR